MRLILILAFIGLCTAGLRDKARRIYIGVAITPSHFSSQQYYNIAATEFSSVTAEWQMKEDPIWNNPGNPNFDYAEPLMRFAVQHNQEVRGHALVWHESVPTWVEALENNPAELERVFSQHITGTASHFRGRVVHWDVVNEVLQENGQMRNTIFWRVFGTSYINTAFRLARLSDPYAKLYINDYNIEGINAKSNALYNLILNLRAQGVEINGVGFQGHFIVGQLPGDMIANFQRFANLGLDIAITELDIRMTLPATQANLAQQARDYETVFNACFAISRCLGVTVWGVTDLYSWVPSTFPGQGAALLFDENYSRKPAYYAVDNIIH